MEKVEWDEKNIHEGEGSGSGVGMMTVVVLF